MSSGGTQAHLFPRWPIAVAFHRWLKQQDWEEGQNRGHDNRTDSLRCPPIERLAMDSGLTVDFLYALKNRDHLRFVDFDMADKVITAINPSLWHDDPNLKTMYQEFDLARLDARRPIVKAAA